MVPPAPLDERVRSFRAFSMEQLDEGNPSANDRCYDSQNRELLSDTIHFLTPTFILAS